MAILISRVLFFFIFDSFSLKSLITLIVKRFNKIYRIQLTAIYNIIYRYIIKHPSKYLLANL